jgi:hypothetical protein
MTHTNIQPQFDTWEQKVLDDFVVKGRIKAIPAKQKKQLVVLRWLAEQIEPGVTYTERQISERLQQFHPDYAALRRYLVDFHFLEREGGGGLYWRV